MVKNKFTIENSSNYEIIIRLKSGSKVMEFSEVERIISAGMPSLTQIGSTKTPDELFKVVYQIDLYTAALDALRQRPLTKAVRLKGTRRSQRIKK